MSKERVTTFFDAVLAILITLLTVEMKQPSDTNLQAIWEVRYEYLSFLVSFIILGNSWINNHNIFIHVKRVNGRTLFLLLVHVFFLSFVPYWTVYLSNHINNNLAETTYGINIFLISYTYKLYFKELIKYNDFSGLSNLMKLRRFKNFGKITINTLDLIIILMGIIITNTIFTQGVIFSVFISMIIWIIPTIKSEKILMKNKNLKI